MLQVRSFGVIPWQLGLPQWLSDKESTCNAGDTGDGGSPGWEDPLEDGMVTHSSILAWRNPMDRGVWWAIVQGVPKSWT